MSKSMTEQLLERIVQTTVPGGRLLHTSKLEGGTSADMILLHLIMPDGQPRRLILRRRAGINSATDRTLPRSSTAP